MALANAKPINIIKPIMIDLLSICRAVISWVLEVIKAGFFILDAAIPGFHKNFNISLGNWKVSRRLTTNKKPRSTCCGVFYKFDYFIEAF